MKLVVIYKGKTGFTERYAAWIAEEAGGEAVCWKNRAKVRLRDYDAVVFGGRFHAGSIDGLAWFKKQLPRLEGKKTAVFATGAMPSGSPDIKAALARNIPESEQEALPAFYMPGGLCYEKMGGIDKLMMSVFRRMLQKTQGDSEAARAVQSSYDLSSREHITPLVEWLVRASAT